MFNCPKCNKEIRSKPALGNHLRFCTGKGYIPKRIYRSRKQELWICPLCNQEIKSNRQKHLDYCNGRGKRRLRPKDYTHGGGWNKGKTYEEMFGKTKADELKSNLSKNCSGGRGKTDEIEKERKRKISDAIKQRYANGWLPKAGRCKKIKYFNKNEGKEITVDGTWELSIAEYLDKHEIVWIRNARRFEYINLVGKQSYYTPDFYLPILDSYIEVKGYETDLDRCKWMQFKYELIILKKKEINKVRKGEILEIWGNGIPTVC